MGCGSNLGVDMYVLLRFFLSSSEFTQHRIPARNRHINRHGLEFARLDRSQAVVLRDEDPAPTCIERLLEIFLLGLCERTSKRLDNVWINRVVYQRYWVSFLKALHHEWAIAGAGVCGRSLFRNGMVLT